MGLGTATQREYRMGIISRMAVVKINNRSGGVTSARNVSISALSRRPQLLHLTTWIDGAVVRTCLGIRKLEDHGGDVGESDCLDRCYGRYTG